MTGDGEKTIGSRWNKGHVQEFESYRFKPQAYHSEEYIFKSLDTWLMGICRSHCPLHTWKTRAETFKPSKKSVFSETPPQQQTPGSGQQQTGQNDDPDENATDSDSEADATSGVKVARSQVEAAKKSHPTVGVGGDCPDVEHTVRVYDNKSGQYVDVISVIRSDSSDDEEQEDTTDCDTSRPSTSCTTVIGPRYSSSKGLVAEGIGLTFDSDEDSKQSTKNQPSYAFTRSPSFNEACVKYELAKDVTMNPKDGQKRNLESALSVSKLSFPQKSQTERTTSRTNIRRGIDNANNDVTTVLSNLVLAEAKQSSSDSGLDSGRDSRNSSGLFDIRASYSNNEIDTEGIAKVNVVDLNSNNNNNGNDDDDTKDEEDDDQNQWLEEQEQETSLNQNASNNSKKGKKKSATKLNKHTTKFHKNTLNNLHTRTLNNVTRGNLNANDDTKGNLNTNNVTKGNQNTSNNIETLEISSNDFEGIPTIGIIDPLEADDVALETVSIQSDLTAEKKPEAEIKGIKQSPPEKVVTVWEEKPAVADPPKPIEKPYKEEKKVDKKVDLRSRTTNLAQPKEPQFIIVGTNGVPLIERALIELGWKRNPNKSSDNYKLKWVECKSHINYNSFKEGVQLVNRIPNCYLLTNKLGLLNSLQRYERVQYSINPLKSRGKMTSADFLPETYRIDDSIDRCAFFSKYRHDRSGKLWICKPCGMNQGKGISIVRDVQEFEKTLDEREGSLHSRSVRPMERIIQRYIMNPLLLENRKFDIRAYMLIASTTPFLVLYHKGYVRLCLTPYSTNDQNLTTHLTNQFIQRKDKEYAKNKEDTVWTMDKFNEYVNEHLAEEKGIERDWVYNTLTVQMKQIVNYCFNAVKHKLKTRHGYFDLYGLDFMIDEDMNISLIEINVNPCLATNCLALKEVVPEVVREAILIAVECFEKTKRSQKLLPLQNMKTFQVVHASSSRHSLRSSSSPPRRLDPITQAPAPSSAAGGGAGGGGYHHHHHHQPWGRSTGGGHHGAHAAAHTASHPRSLSTFTTPRARSHSPTRCRSLSPTKADKEFVPSSSPTNTEAMQSPPKSGGLPRIDERMMKTPSVGSYVAMPAPKVPQPTMTPHSVTFTPQSVGLRDSWAPDSSKSISLATNSPYLSSSGTAGSNEQLPFKFTHKSHGGAVTQSSTVLSKSVAQSTLQQSPQNNTSQYQSFVASFRNGGGISRLNANSQALTLFKLTNAQGKDTSSAPEEKEKDFTVTSLPVSGNVQTQSKPAATILSASCTSLTNGIPSIMRYHTNGSAGSTRSKTPFADYRPATPMDKLNLVLKSAKKLKMDRGS